MAVPKKKTSQSRKGKRRANWHLTCPDHNKCPHCGAARQTAAPRSDELLDGEIFDTLLEAQVLVERWRRYYNTVKPHSSLGYRPPGGATALGSGPRFARPCAQGCVGRPKYHIETGITCRGRSVQTYGLLRGCLQPYARRSSVCPADHS